MQCTITSLMKKTEQYFTVIFVFTLILSFSFVDGVQGEDSNYAGNNDGSFIDTLTYGVYNVIRNYTSEVNHYTGTRAGIEEELNLEFEKKSKEGVVSLGSVKFINSWIGFDDPVAELADVQVAFSKDRFLLTENSASGESSIEFAVRHDSLVISPDLLKKLERAVDNPKDTVTGYKNPRHFLKTMQFSDMHSSLLCLLLDVNALIDSSEWDRAEKSIIELKEKAIEAEDSFAKDRCDKIKGTITIHKKQSVPFQLAGAKKVGVILEPPVYPPHDTPSIFWQDTLLCVVQTDATQKKPVMRTWNPATAKWGPVIPARIPNCSMKGYIHVNACNYCEDEPHYWNSALELPGEEWSCDLCECFTDNRPLVSIPAEKVFIFNTDVFDSGMIAMSGGSCIAGHGEYMFGEDGKVYTKDLKTSWDVGLKDSISLSSVEFVNGGSGRAYYPVVVSANQNLIAYAIERSNNGKIELWVARINYMKTDK